MSLLDNITPGPLRAPTTHDEWVAGLRDLYEGSGIGVLDDGTPIRLSTGGTLVSER